jgi:predicted  nucleic acid-binding Zn-ribbon protein
MELIFIIMSTAVGTVAGSVAGVIIAQRFNRRPAGEAAALRMQLQASEASLAAASANLLTLRKEVAEKDQLAQKRLAELPVQMEMPPATADGQNGNNASATDLAREMAARAFVLIEKCITAENTAKDERSRATEETGRKIAELEGLLEAEKRRTREMAEELARAATESSGYKAAVAEVEAARKRVEELNAELERARAEAAQLKQSAEAAAGERARWEAELAVERERAGEAVQQAARVAAEAASVASQRGGIETDLVDARKHVDELEKQLTGVQAELKAAAADATALEEELAAEREHGNKLKAQLGAKTVEAADYKQSIEQGGEKTVVLEKQLAEERERSEEMLRQIVDLKTEVTHLEGRLDEERQTAAKGVALLTAAQDNLARVFKALSVDSQGTNGSSAEAKHPVGVA